MKKSTHFLALLFAAAPSCFGAETPPSSTEQTPYSTKPESKNNHVWQIFPHDHLYPTKIADPQRETFAAQAVWVSESTLPDCGNNYIDLKMGGRLGIFRYSPEQNPAYGIQFSVDIGFHGIFDSDYSLDNIGWDGSYAFSTSFRYHETLSWLLGIHHTSSHIGDEYGERTGIQRINYTREELRGGVNWQFHPHWQAYAEAGWGYYFGNEVLQKPWRVELGAQFETLFEQRSALGWYVAANTEAYEERDWKLDNTLQIGLVSRSGKRHWRLGIEFYDGRFPIAEFFQEDERSISLGIWHDI